jgi:uncharacterized membrane protein (GlpM family)
MIFDPVFLFELALKIVLTATVVVGASVVAERSNPVVSAIIASLPTAAGATYTIFALEHPPEFIANGAVGSLAALAAVSVFSVAYAALAQRQGLLVSLGGSLAVWLIAAAALRSVTWTLTGALILNAVVILPALIVSRRFQLAGPPVAKVKTRASEILTRSLIVAVFVVAVTTASHAISSFVSGMFAVFPIVMGSLIIILHPRIGGPATASVFAHVQIPLVGLALAFVAVHLLAVPVGVWWSYAAALAIVIGWSFGLLLLRPRRT